MVLLEGKKIAGRILAELKNEFLKLPSKPLFADLLVGDDPVSLSYVKIKQKKAESLGIDFQPLCLPAAVASEEVVSKIAELQELPKLGGLIVQLPLPPHIDKTRVAEAIDPNLDIDCIGTENSRLFYEGRPRFIPPATAAIMAILNSAGVDLSGKKILVIGQGELVGKPVSFLLKKRGLQVETADRNSGNLRTSAKTADVIISGTGQAGLISGDMIKKGAIVIDAGTAESGGSIVGDVDLNSVSEIAAFVSPVPGGVGPLTVAMLYRNFLEACKRKFFEKKRPPSNLLF